MEMSPNFTPSVAAAAAGASVPEANAAEVKYEEEEEFWPTIGIGQSIQVRREVQEISLTRNSHLRLWMLQEKDLTPLDMTYDDDWKKIDEHDDDGGGDGGGDDGGDDNDYYDGTGGMLWMAATCWCIMISLQVPSLMQYLQRRRPSSVSSMLSKGECHHQDIHQHHLHHRVCELGCGTGAAGIALLKFCSGRTRSRGRQRGTNLNNAKTETDNDADDTLTTNVHHYHHDDYHVVFTDSDKESLDWCQRNCELNNIDPNKYCQIILTWGLPGIQRLQQQQQHPGKNEPTSLKSKDEKDDSTNNTYNNTNDYEEEEEKENLIIPHSFDTIIATDVIYDLTMILPLFQTAELLLVNNNNTSEQKKCHGHEDSGKNEDQHDDDKKKEDHKDNLDDDGSVEGKYDDRGGNYVILTHVPRFCLPQEEEKNGNNRNDTDDDDNDNNDDNEKETTNYLELEQHIIKIAATVGFTLKDMLRVDETLKEWCHSDSDSWTTTEDLSLSLEKIHDSHAVILVFERS